MVAQFKTKEVYGNQLIYPVNEIAQKLTTLAGRKTVDKVQIRLIEELGFTVEFVASNPL